MNIWKVMACLFTIQQVAFAAELPYTRFSLANGLTVTLRPLASANHVTLLTLFSVGEKSDPPGQSGLAHFVEHLYVTAAAGKMPARTAEEMMRSYKRGWNAQTGSDYTVVATVFDPSDLETEIAQAAARMNTLRIEQDDLERERPRILQELHNMYAGMPALAARNRALGMIRPVSDGGRKGGVPADLKNIDLQTVTQHWRRFYKPHNAHLVLAGDFEAAKARKLIEDSFALIPAGEELPPWSRIATPRFGPATFELATHPGSRNAVCLAISAPTMDDELFPAYLIIAAKLMASGHAISGPQDPFPATYAVLDGPEAMFICKSFPSAEEAAATEKELREFVRQTIEEVRSADAEVALQMFGFLLGLTELSDQAVAQNTYGVAFSLARTQQLKINSEELRRKIRDVTNDELRLAAREFFAEDRSALVSVITKE